MSTFNFALPVNILKEGDVFVAYTPALELSTVGDSFEEAQKNFDEAVNLFFEELIAEDKLDSALSELGWQKGTNQEFMPPVIVSTSTEKYRVPLTI